MTKPVQRQQGNICEIRLPCYGIVLRLSRENTTSEPGRGSITSNLKVSGETAVDPLDPLYNAAIDGIESLILAHACAGVHVESPEYVEGIETAVEAVVNHFS